MLSKNERSGRTGNGHPPAAAKAPTVAADLPEPNTDSPSRLVGEPSEPASAVPPPLEVSSPLRDPERTDAERRGEAPTESDRAVAEGARAEVVPEIDVLIPSPERAEVWRGVASTILRAPRALLRFNEIVGTAFADDIARHASWRPLATTLGGGHIALAATRGGPVLLHAEYDLGNRGSLRGYRVRRGRMRIRRGACGPAPGTGVLELDSLLWLMAPARVEMVAAEDSDVDVELRGPSAVHALGGSTRRVEAGQADEWRFEQPLHYGRILIRVRSGSLRSLVVDGVLEPTWADARLAAVLADNSKASTAEEPADR